ncbi:MAG: hypothetical protein H6656_02545 [Ardenticatenaceae bacterium]|nr:hypothetical protein [Ardenticatenaceae bacterium]
MPCQPLNASMSFQMRSRASPPNSFASKMLAVECGVRRKMSQVPRATSMLTVGA